MHAVSAAAATALRAALPPLLPTLLPALLALALLPAGCSSSAVQPGRQEAAALEESSQSSAETPPSAVPAPRPVPPDALDGELVAAEIATVGWDRFTNAPLVLLRDLESGQVIPIWVGLAEARAIAIALAEVEMPRPMTHDLMVHLIDALHAKLERVVVRDLVDGTYLGLLELRVEGEAEPLLIDTRPSDGLALAARTGAAISVARKILDESPDYEFLAPEGSDQIVRFSGLTLVAPTPEQREQFRLPERDGLLITRAVGTAATQGLERGDFIVEVRGKVPTEPMDFLDAVEEAPPGTPLPLTYWRDGEEHALELIPELPTLPGTPQRGPKQIA